MHLPLMHLKHHGINALSVGILFAAVDFVRESTPFDVLIIARPIIFALIIWAFLVPTTAILLDNFAKYFKGIKIPLIIPLTLAPLIASFPISFFIPWLTLILNLGGEQTDNSWMSISLYDNFLLFRYSKFATFITVLWILVNYRWYAQFLDSEKAPSDITQPLNTRVIDEIPPSPSKVGDVQLAPEETPLTSQQPTFLKLSKKTLGKEIYLISAEQHYIRVVTSLGEDMILYRFSDAVKDMAQLNPQGIQVHRSHWVHPTAITHIEPSKRSFLIHIKNGDQIPVARSNKSLLDHAGWFDRFCT